MAWIEFHASDIVRLKKFHDLRKACAWSEIEGLGFLGRFWCLVIEVRENGDVSDWDGEYIAQIMGFTDQVGKRVWEALVAARWLERNTAGRLVVHDWIDYAGAYLRGRYSGKNRAKLIDIWRFHGKEYGVDGKSIESQSTINRLSIVQDRTVPYPTKPKNVRPSALELEAFGPDIARMNQDATSCVRVRWDRFWAAYPRKTAKAAAWRVFHRLDPSDELLATMLEGLEAHKRQESWLDGGGRYIPHPATWLNGRRWEDDLSAPKAPLPGEKGYQVTDVDRVIKAFRICQNIPDTDENWRKVMWIRQKPEAQALLDYFGGNWRMAARCVERTMEQCAKMPGGWGWKAVMSRAAEVKREEEEALHVAHGP